MMADDAPTNATETPENAADESTAGNESAAGAEPQQDLAPEAKTEAGPKADAKAEASAKAEAGAKAEAKPAKAKPAPEPEEEPEPVPDPETCKAIALGLPAFGESALAGEWDGTDFEYYLEPAGVLNGPLACSRAPENDPQRAGLLMTRAAWKAKTLFLDDGINPDTYELSFPKEFGYVKPLAHYKEETRELAQFPWSKKY
jgi:hypothetical protein